MPQSVEYRVSGTAADEETGRPTAGIDDTLSGQVGEKAARVRAMFSAIAPTYDLLNTLLSFGIDSLWRSQGASAALESSTGAGSGQFADRPRLLDVATGTGKMALALKRRRPSADVIGVDFAEPMLAVARSAATRRRLDVSFEQADGTDLPFEDASFDAVTITYGLRNFADPDAGMREFRRVLKTGGRLVILEFPPPRPGPFGRVFSAYFQRILPRIGGAVSGEREAYSYLPRSVLGFMTPAELAAQMRAAGFGNIRQRLQSFGISSMHVGEAIRPDERQRDERQDERQDVVQEEQFRG